MDKIQPCAIGKVIKTLNIDEISSIGLIAKMKTEYQCDVSYKTAWAAIKKVKKSSGMILDNSYQFIPSIVESIRQNGDFSSYQCDANERFERFFMMWNSAKEFFLKSRKLL